MQLQFHFFDILQLTVLQISDRHESLLHHSSLTGLVYCCLLSFLTLLFSGQVFTDSAHSHTVSSSPKCLDPLYTGYSRLLAPLPLLWRYYTSWIPPIDPLKFHQNAHWMTCHPLQLPQPSPSFFNLLFLAWTSFTHSSFLLHLIVVSRGRKQAQVTPTQPPRTLTCTHHPCQQVSQSKTQEKPLWSPHCTQALVSVPKKKID